jgi:hypothetical protein
MASRSTETSRTRTSSGATTSAWTSAARWTSGTPPRDQHLGRPRQQHDRGLTVNDRNVISGNGNDAIVISDSGTTGTRAGNLLGTNATGTAAIPNLRGIEIRGGTTGNTVGGPAGSENLISGNGAQGIAIADAGTSNNTVTRALIGTNAAGTGAIPNNGGIDIVNGATNNTIGGATGTGNVISGNASNGVYLNGPATSGNSIVGNIIGLDVPGAAALGNGGSGVVISPGRTGT